MNEQMDAKDTAKVMAEFTKQNEYMNVKEDMLDDALMDAFDGDDVEEEADSVVNQVLTEIGLDVGARMTDAPTGKLSRQQEEEAEAAEEKAAMETLEKLLPSMP
eukprot:evm.model.NODE_32581_length_16376_cov_18.250671.8